MSTTITILKEKGFDRIYRRVTNIKYHDNFIEFNTGGFVTSSGGVFSAVHVVLSHHARWIIEKEIEEEDNLSS